MPKYKSKPVKPVTAEAVQCSCDMSFGSLTGKAFDWFVTETDSGKQYFLSPDEFAERFELVEGSRTRAKALEDAPPAPKVKV